MNILFLCHQERNFGAWWRFWFLARGLAKLGHKVTQATVSRSSRWHSHTSREDGVTIWEGPNLLHDLPGQGTGPLDILGRMNLVRRGHFDVIHGSEFFPNIRFPIAWTGSYQKSLVLSDWCDWYSRGGLGPTWGRYKFVQNLISKQEDEIRLRSHAVTVISRTLGERTQSLGIPKDKILYVPGGAPVDVIRPEDRRAARRRWQIDPEAKLVEFMGTNQGDLDLLLEAFRRVAEQIPGSRLLLVGPKNPLIQTRAKELNLSDRIIETGVFKYADLSSLLACADVFALPLRDTVANCARWPNKIGEYMAAGRPTVAHAVGEMKILFGKYAIGLTAGQDSESFSAAIVEVLNSPAKAETWGREARRVAEEVLAWDKLSRDLDAFYKTLAPKQEMAC